jgi:hypothetical protein
MRWSSARIGFSILVGLALLVLLLCALSDTVHLVPERGSQGYAMWYLLAAGRVLIPHAQAIAVLVLLAVGLATGVLPGGAWPDLQPRGAARPRALRLVGWTFTIAVMFGLVLATPMKRYGIDVRPPMVAAFEVAVITGAILTWIAMGAHRGAAIGTLALFAAGLFALARWSPWWKRFDFSTLVGPWYLVHLAWITVVSTGPFALLMVVLANLRMAPAFRFTPGLAVLLVSGMFVLSGYLVIFSPFHSSPMRRSLSVSGHR